MNPDQLQVIRQALQLNSGIFVEIPDDLLMLAFIARGATINPQLQRQMQQKYGVVHYEYLEFFGDAILEMIVTEFLFDHRRNIRLSQAHHIRQAIVKNETLRCLMMQRNLCQYTVYSQAVVPSKVCADSLEALIGVIYTFLRYIAQRDDAYTLTYSWFTRTFNLPSLVKMISQGQALSCQYQSSRPTQVPPTVGPIGPIGPIGPSLQTRPAMVDQPFAGEDLPWYEQMNLIPHNLPPTFEPTFSTHPSTQVYDSLSSWANYHDD